MTRYKKGDLVMSHGLPIIGYGEHGRALTNMLCIVRETHLRAAKVPIYTCTTVATGEEVDLLETEIQHLEGADNE